MEKSKEPTITKPIVEEKTYGLAQLRANCLTLFGVTQSTFDGATQALTSDISVEIIKDTIKIWQKKEVK